MLNTATLTRIRQDTARVEPLSPDFILRVHSAQINHLCFSEDGQFLISSDADGYVAVWSLNTFRPLLFWRAHTASVLCTEAWGDKFITHGRDDRIHVFLFPELHLPISSDGISSGPSHSNLSTVEAVYTLEVTSLSFCKCALYQISASEALIAVQSITKDEEIDVFHLPSKLRVSRAIGRNVWPINDKTGTVMAVSLHSRQDGLRLLAAYEDGRIAIFDAERPETWDLVYSEEGGPWKLIWHGKGHSEPIMGMSVASDFSTAWTVGADRYIVRWNLADLHEASKDEDIITKIATKTIGRSAIATRDDNRIVAAGEWDGTTHVYSAKTGKQLAVLSFHRDSVYSVAFCPLLAKHDSEDKAWLATAGKDQRIALWNVYPVERVRSEA